MINVKDIRYRVSALREGEEYDLTDTCSALGWQEGAKELAAKIQFKVTASENLSFMQPMTEIKICADIGQGWQEAVRGRIQKISYTETNDALTLDVEAADCAASLRQNQQNFYFTEGHSSSAILEEVLKAHGVDYSLDIKDEKHSKKVYRAKYISDIVADVLKDLKEKGGDAYFIRAREGILEIIPRGTNSIVYSFDIDENIISVKESFDASKLATQVQVVSKTTDEARPKVEATVKGRTDLGKRNRIYHRSDKESLGEAESAAKKLLDEQGAIVRKTTIETPDVPFLRKGDLIRVKNSLGTGFFFVKSVRHNAAQIKMTLELDWANEKNKELGLDYDLAWTDETS